jgi:uncharacterized protein
VPLDISRAMRSPGESFTFIHKEVLPPQDVVGQTVTFDNPVTMEGEFCLVEDRLRLSGRLSTVANAPCANCLSPAKYPVLVDFDEMFMQHDKFTKVDDYLDETDRLAYDGSQLDIHQLALTLAVLELPIRFLCQEDCKGLLTVTRIDDKHAGQKELPIEHPFSALQQLLTKDQEV